MNKDELELELTRLRAIVDYIRSVGRMRINETSRIMSIMEKVLTHEEYLEWIEEKRLEWRGELNE